MRATGTGARRAFALQPWLGKFCNSYLTMSTSMQMHPAFFRRATARYNSALALGPADHAFGSQASNLACRICKPTPRLGRCSEARGVRAGWTWFDPAGWGGNALVPVLGDDIAAMVGVDEGLVDLLHRTHRRPAASRRWHSGSASCWLNTAASSSAQRVAVGDAILVQRNVGRCRVGLPKISFARLRKVHADADEDVVGAGGKISIHGTRYGYSVAGEPGMKVISRHADA